VAPAGDTGLTREP